MTKIDPRLEELRSQGIGLLEARRIIKREDRRKRLSTLWMQVFSSWFVRRKHMLELISIIEDLHDGR